MKSRLYCLFIALFISISAYAQNYQPFSKNSYVYRFDGTDDYYKLTVDSVTVDANNDSVFHFNPIVHLTGPTGFTDRYTIDKNNIFGSKFIKKSNGDYYFLVFNDSLLIKKQNEKDSTWLFSKNKNITAMLKYKTIENVFNQSDSVITILLSTGDIIKISKNFGLVESKILIRQPYINADYDLLETGLNSSMILASIPTKKTGLNYPGFSDIFNFQTNDIFGYEGKGEYYVFPPSSSQDFTTKQIIKQSTNKNKDTVTITQEIKYYETRFVHPNTYIKTQKGIETIKFSKTEYSYLEANSLQYTELKNLSYLGYLFYKLAYQESTKKFVLKFDFVRYDFNRNLVGYIADGTSSVTFTQRLGETENYNCCEYRNNLVCYSINDASETWGKCPDLNKLLSIEENIEPKTAFQILPNPSTNEITIKGFTKTNSNSNDLIKITDLRGKFVHQQKLNSLQDQDHELKIDVSSLQNGLFFLHFISGNGRISSQKFIISK